MLSLSARRAWIEILLKCSRITRFSVALRKESVDRNVSRAAAGKVKIRSLSARRAWIEIAATRTAACAWIRRSPQGERG